MSKTIVTSVIFISLFAGGLVYTLANKEDPEKSSTGQISQDIYVEEPGDLSDAAGGYVDYSEATLASAQGERILFFHASWCSQCRSIEKGILAGPIPDGITIVKVDYDSNQNLRKKYGVTLQTTFVKIDQNGNLVDKYVAYDEPTFDAVKRNFL